MGTDVKLGQWKVYISRRIATIIYTNTSKGTACCRRIRKIAKNKYLFLLSVCPSVRMEQLGSH